MIYNKKEFYGGIAALVAFTAVMIFMFQPVFSGHNSMEYLDDLYNSISKGSIDYAPGIKEEAAAYDGKQVTMKLAYNTAVEAAQSQALFAATGSEVSLADKTLTVTGSLGTILKGSLDDAILMYNNDGATVQNKYGQEPRRALYNWWTSLYLMDKDLKAQGLFAEAKITSTAQTKAIEASYNYYEIEPIKIMDKLGLVIFSLVFYVFYTLWYGFAILWIFEGWGLKLSH